MKDFFNKKKFSYSKILECIASAIYIEFVKPYEPTFTCLPSTMKHQYVKYVKNKPKPCVKYIKSILKVPEEHE